MTKTIRPTKIPAISFTRKTITAIITIRAIIATIISTIIFPKPITALVSGIKRLNKCLGIIPESVAVRKEMCRKIQLTNIGYCLHLGIVAFKLLQVKELIVEIDKHTEVDGLNKTFLQESALICLLYVNMSIYLEITIDRYLFIVIYAYYKYASRR
jgi:hypothetical protein